MIATSFTITLGWVAIPICLTIVMLALMLWPTKRCPTGHMGLGALMDGIGAVFRLLWLIPILIVWIVYLALT